MVSCHLPIKGGLPAPDIARVSRSPLSAAARAACLDQVMRALWRSALLGIPASTLLAMILGSSVPVSRRIAFVVFVSVADIASMACAGHYLRVRRAGTVIARYPAGLVCMILVALAWASPALFALPGDHNVELRAVYLLFVCGTSATWVVGTAARRLYFYASQIPLLLIVGAAFTLSGDRVTRLLGLSVPIYFIVMASLHHEVHGVVVSELQLREHNDETNAQLRDANAQLVRRALRDELTGLANRAAFVDVLQRAVGDAREHGTIVGVLYFDVDRLKVVNDSLGHATGDMLLVQIARARAPDVAHDRRARRVWAATSSRCCSTSCAATRRPSSSPSGSCSRSSSRSWSVGRAINVSASIGVATNREARDDAETLLSFADAAQYRAKQSGRNRIEVFDIKLRAAIESRLDDEHALRDAIANGTHRSVLPARGRSA